MEESVPENELVEISINHKGVDLTAIVTLEEANVLMNDETAAQNYAEALVAQHTAEDFHDTPKVVKKESDCLSTKEATTVFLDLRTEYMEKFNDRKTAKCVLWQKLAADMKNKGYDIPQGKEGAEKCRQKFANLQRVYVNYIKHIRTTGEEKRDPPPYFDQMNKILGDKDKITPPYLEDSLDTTNINEAIAHSSASSSSSSDHQNSCSSGFTNKQKKIANRFSASHTSVRPTTNFNKVIELFKEQHEQSRADRERHIKIFEEAMKVQNEQRARFLDFLQNTKKRKRCSSSSSDE